MSPRNHLRTVPLAARIGFHRVDEPLALVELCASADRPARTSSLGMRQRLGLPGALLASSATGEPHGRA